MARRRSNSGAVVVREMTDAGAVLSPVGALFLGAIVFTIFYFILPAWLASLLADQQYNQHLGILETVLRRSIRVVEWVGIACGLTGVFFAIRNHLIRTRAHRSERSLVATIARFLGRSLD